VLAAYDSVFFDIGDIELVLLAEWWAAFDPEAAYTWSFETWRANHPAIRLAVLRGWGRVDPAAALLRASVASTSPAEHMRAVIAGWDESGRPGLYETLRGMGPGAERQRLIEMIARRRVLRDGIEPTFRWAEALPDDDDYFKLHVFQRVASSAAEIDPERAAGWASKHEGQPYAWDLARRVGTRWAKREPEKAMAWVESLPESHSRSLAVRETYLAWLRKDKPAAREFVRSREVTPWLEPAVSLYAKSLMTEDPTRGAEALGWAQRISDPVLRDATIILVARSWSVADPAATEAWLASADLSDLVRQKIREIPKRQQRAAERRRTEAQAAETQPPAPAEPLGVEDVAPWAPPLPED
jgi:hypothetical protein